MVNATAGSISRTIIERVADAEGVDPIDITVPLFEVIDPDALDSLFVSPEHHSTMKGEVNFSYLDYQVTVTSDGEVSITEAEAASSD